MIRFFIWLFLTLIMLNYYKKYKYNWHFQISDLNDNLDLNLIIFLYYDKDKNIKKGKIIVPRESSFEIKELLEDLFLEKIPI